MEDCVQIHPANALQAWQQVISPFKSEIDYLQDWIDTGAYQGLQHGKRNPSDGSYEDFDQAHLITERFSIDKMLEDVKSSNEAKQKACVAVWDKNSTKEELKQRTTKCGKGLSCATINEDGYFESAAKRAERVAKRNGQGAVARGFCIKPWHQTTSNMANRHNKNERLQKAEDLIANQRDQIRSLRNLPPSACRSKK